MRNLPRPLTGLRPAALASVAALAVGTLAACGGTSAGSSTDPGDPVAGGTLVYATGDVEPTCLDPDAPGNVAQALVATNYLESLFFQDEAGEIQPWLAESWTWSKDRLALDITLRQGVSFTDGTPLNAETVKANVEHIKDPETLSATALIAMEYVDRVEVVDEHTARVVLSQPDSSLLEHFAQVWLPMHSQKSLERPQEEICEAPVGTGPFVVDSWTRQKEIVLVRNEDYSTPPPAAAHEGPAHLERIEWRFLPDPAARYAALQSGEVDVIDVIQPQDAVAADASGNLRTLVGSRPGHVVNISLNTKNPALRDVRVREAISRAIDVQSALDSVFLGTVEKSDSVLSSITRYNLQEPEVFAHDAARAEELLDAAGWTATDADGIRTKEGKRLELTWLQADYLPLPIPAIEQFQASLKKVGIDLTIEQEETSTFSERRNNWDYDLVGLYYTKNSPSVLDITLHSKNIESVPGGYHGNSFGLVNDETAKIDTWLDKAVAASDEQARGEAFEEAQRIAHRQYVSLPLFDQQSRLGIGERVEGVTLLSPLGMPYLYDAWKKSS